MAFEGFLLAERSGEWDEVWVAGVVPDSTTLICRSTTEDGGDWLWTLLKCEVGALRPPVGAGAARTAPAGVAPASVNWVCTPAQPHQKWNPSAAEIAALKQEASLLGLHVKGNRHDRCSDHSAGSWHESDTLGRSTTGARRCYGTGSKRGCRGARAGTGCRRRGWRILQSSKPGGCDSGVERHGKAVERRRQKEEGQEKEEKEKRQEKEEEEKLFDLKFKDQPIPIKSQQQSGKQQQLLGAPAVEKQGEGSEGEVRGDPCGGQGEVQAQGGVVGICHKTPWSVDSALPCQHLRSSLKGEDREELSVAGGECGGMGSSTFRSFRSEGMWERYWP